MSAAEVVFYILLGVCISQIDIHMQRRKSKHEDHKDKGPPKAAEPEGKCWVPMSYDHRNGEYVYFEELPTHEPIRRKAPKKNKRNRTKKTK